MLLVHGAPDSREARLSTEDWGGVEMAQQLGQMIRPLLVVMIIAGWISAGMREHEAEFTQEWVQRFGNTAIAGKSAVPPATYKAWYKQFKKTGVRPAEWLATLSSGPPTGSII
jgi:hypothetical protein